MALSVWNGTSWVASKDVKVWNGTSWVSAAAGKIWNGTTWVDFLTKITLTGQTISSNFSGSSQASAVYGLGSDGYVWEGAYSTTQNFVQGDTWIDPTSQASNYEAYVTMVSGTLTSGTVGSWVALDPTPAPAATPFWRITVGYNQIKSATFTIQVRRVGTTTILGTATIVLNVDTSNA